MDVLLRGHAARLDDWQRRPFWPEIASGPRESDAQDRYRRDVATEPPGDPTPGGPFTRLAASILRYRIFPPSLVEGVLARAPLQLGDTVGILYKGFGPVHLFFAARVVACFRGALEGRLREGFTYRTIVGHPELGEETFAVEKDLATGAVTVELRSWSRPGTTVARLAAPVVRLLQVRASRAALDHLATIAA